MKSSLFFLLAGRTPVTPNLNNWLCGILRTLFVIVVVWGSSASYAQNPSNGAEHEIGRDLQIQTAVPRKVRTASGTSPMLLADSGAWESSSMAGPNRFVPAWLRGFSLPQMAEQPAHEMDFAYYSRRAGFKSTLRLVSASPQMILLTITVHNLSGMSFRSPAMEIGAQSSLVLDLDNLLRSAPLSFDEGSLSVSYAAAGPMPLGGQITIENRQMHLAYESRMVENDPTMSQLSPELHSVWWGLKEDREAVLAISNTAAESVTGEVLLDVKGKRYPGEALSFQPHETKILAIRDLLANTGDATRAQEGGITVRFTGPGNASSLIAQGRVLDFGSGFSTTLNFTSPMSMPTNVFDASGIPVGIPSSDSPYSGMGDFTPHVILRNLLAIPQDFGIVLSYPTQNGTGSYTVPAHLGKYEVRDISLKAAVEQMPNPVRFASIRISGSGPAGSAVGEVSSVDRPGDLVVDSYLVNEGDNMHANSGMNPWHLDQQTESILFLTNTGDQVAKIGLQVVVAGVHYFVTNIQLQPHEIRELNLRTLRDGQKPDFHKNKIPASAADGDLLWAKLDGPTVMGRLLIISKEQAVSSSFSCGADCLCGYDYKGTEITSSSSVTLMVGGSYQFQAQDLYEDCYGTQYWFATSGIWSTDNSQIASIDNSGKLTANAGGAVTVTVDDGGDCVYNNFGDRTCNCVQEDYPGQGSATVNDPTPNITGLTSPWQAGANNNVTISGSGFGTNKPNVTINDPSGYITSADYSVTGYNDTTITLSVNVPGPTPLENVSVTVTSTGYSGYGFTSNQGPPTSPSKTAQINPANVSISGPAGIVNGSSAGFSVSDPNGIPLTLTITASGNGRASFSGGPSANVSGSTTLTTSGTATSSSANDLTMTAKDQYGTSLASVGFSVIWVTLQLNTSGPLQSDDDVAQRYNSNTGSSNLGLLSPALIGIEIQGTVAPSNFSDNITLVRRIVSLAQYDDASSGSTSVKQYSCSDVSYATCTNDSGTNGSDIDNTPPPNGHIYNWDTPGAIFGNTPAPNEVNRLRVNFVEWATYNNQIASSPLLYYSRSSVEADSNSVQSFDSSVTGDNKAATGSTLTSWNLN